jgi:predicted nucleic acid-binding protein
MIQALEHVATHPDAARWAGEARRRGGRTGPRTLGDALIAAVVTRNVDDFVRMGVTVVADEADVEG